MVLAFVKVYVFDVYADAVSRSAVPVKPVVVMFGKSTAVDPGASLAVSVIVNVPVEAGL